MGPGGLGARLRHQGDPLSEAQQAPEGFGAASGRQFKKWGLIEAERDIALLLVKGLSHKGIAAQRRTSEGPVRQPAAPLLRLRFGGSAACRLTRSGLVS